MSNSKCEICGDPNPEFERSVSVEIDPWTDQPAIVDLDIICGKCADKIVAAIEIMKICNEQPPLENHVNETDFVNIPKEERT